MRRTQLELGNDNRIWTSSKCHQQCAGPMATINCALHQSEGARQDRSSNTPTPAFLKNGLIHVSRGAGSVSPALRRKLLSASPIHHPAGGQLDRATLQPWREGCRTPQSAAVLFAADPVAISIQVTSISRIAGMNRRGSSRPSSGAVAECAAARAR